MQVCPRATRAMASRPLSRSIPISPLQRIGLTVGSAITAFVDPARGDMIAMLGELTGDAALARMRDRMQQDPDGAWLLQHRPRIRQTHLDVEALRKLPTGSFGHAYAQYLDRYGFSPEERSEVRLIRDPQLAYVMTRYREIHDFWHVLAGMPPSVLGETVVKWLEMVQTGLPMTALSSFVAPVRLSREERRLLFSVYVPWASATGKASRYLMAVRYEELLALPLEEVRRLLRFQPAPPLQVR